MKLGNRRTLDKARQSETRAGTLSQRFVLQSGPGQSDNEALASTDTTYVSWYRFEVNTCISSYIFEIIYFMLEINICFIIDLLTTEPISSLQNRFLYYRVDFFTTESIALLQSRLPYYRINFSTTESISLLQNRLLYSRIDFFTTEATSVLRSLLLYNRIDFSTTESISLRQAQNLHVHRLMNLRMHLHIHLHVHPGTF